MAAIVAGESAKAAIWSLKGENFMENLPKWGHKRAMRRKYRRGVRVDWRGFKACASASNFWRVFNGT